MPMFQADPTQLEAQLDNGLIMGHAYSITSVALVSCLPSLHFPSCIFCYRSLQRAAFLWTEHVQKAPFKRLFFRLVYVSCWDLLIQLMGINLNHLMEGA